MISRWFELKPKAVLLRKKGFSIVKIENDLGVPRSTLSGWFKYIKITQIQKNKLEARKRKGLIKARKIAVIWHNKQKENRLKTAEKEANELISKVRDSQENIELALALLYLGEGFKKNLTTGMGNSDPLILKFFLEIMVNIYKIDTKKIKLELHLRADQDPELMKKYWAKELNVPLENFRKTSIDKRTLGSKTYPYYKGVCLIDCSNVAIQRKLVYIGRKFCEKTIKNLRG